MRGMSIYDAGYGELLEELVAEIAETSIICPPFHCDHGDGVKLGEHVFVNANCTFLDGGYITIGAHTLVGPCVQIYTPHHPMDYLERRGSKEYAYPVTIGEDCWIGGGVYYLSRRDNWQSLCDRSGERCDERYSRRQCGSRESGTCCSQTACLTFDRKSYFPDLSVPALLSLLGIRFPADSILIINDREKEARLSLFCSVY